MTDQGFSHIAFFDVDHTLIPENSGKSLILRARREGLMRKRDFVHAVYLALLFRMNWRDPMRIIPRMAGWLEGVSENELNELVGELFADRLASAIPDAIYREMDMHRKLGARLVILSASMTPVCNAFAQHLGMDDVICTELETRDGYYTGRTLGRFCYGDEKLVRMINYCRGARCMLEHAWFYSDSVSDLPGLEQVGHPICVNPDKALQRIAQTRGWAVRDWK